MKINKNLYIILIIFILSPFFSCLEEKSTSITYVDTTHQSPYIVGEPYQHFFIDTNTDVNLTYELDLDTDNKDVYFIFTNISVSSSYSSPTFQSSYFESEPRSAANIVSEPDSIVNNSPNEVAMRGKPEITAFNSRPFDIEINENDNSNLSRSIFMTPPEPRFDTVNDSTTFYLDKYNSIGATCKKVATDGTKTVNIWVANNEFEPSGPVTQTMVDELSDKFLIAGTNNDIYDWVTNIYGEEWGTHSFNYLITDTTANDNITILLLDIDGDNNPSGTIGYFYAKDNYKTSSLSWSNGRLMFYMDSNALSEKEDATWEITDRWPSQFVSTLAHEFQHMIHFYQKSVKNNKSSNSEAWLDEMCSMVTEDLVANKALANGPRGIDYSSASPSSPSNLESRLDEYNYYNNYSVTTWPSSSSPIDEILAHYGNKYAFGAYLARNFDGADLFNKIVQNSYLDYRAVTTALAAEGVTDDFGTILKKWAVANLLSDQTDTTAGYKYNNGSVFMNSSIGGVTYNLGSINLFSYSPSPRIRDISDTLPTLNPSSNLYVYAGNLTGYQMWEIQMRKNVRLTVVVK